VRAGVLLAIGTELCDNGRHLTLGHWPGRGEHGDGPAAFGDRYGLAPLDLAEQPGQVGFGFVAAGRREANSFEEGARSTWPPFERNILPSNKKSLPSKGKPPFEGGASEPAERIAHRRSGFPAR